MVGFKPYGIQSLKGIAVKLKYEEYESIKQVVYNNLSQDAAAMQMKVSRPTLTRIYNKALKNIAKALVEGRAIEIVGGNYSLCSDWYRCKKCFMLIQGIENHKKCQDCSFYNEDELVSLCR